MEEHLASCPACREELGRLGTALPAGRRWSPARRFKRQWRRRRVLIAVTAAVTAAAVAGGDLPDLLLGPPRGGRIWRSLELQWSGLTSGEDSEETGAGELEQGTGAA